MHLNKPKEFPKNSKYLKIPIKMALEKISYREPQLWNLVPTEIKDVLSLSIFKENKVKVL